MYQKDKTMSLIGTRTPANGIHTHAQEGTDAARATREAYEARLAAETVDLGDGLVTYPDRLPGVGWVLQRGYCPKWYLRDREAAIEVAPRYLSMHG